jgi:hypothetical protein
VGLLLVLGLATALIVALTRPAPTAATREPASTPEPTASASAATPGDARQHEEYRAYVSTVVDGGTAVAAGMIGLSGCRVSRQACVDRLGEASDQVSRLRRSLSANPAPSCLTAADQRLLDALSFQQKGLDTTRDAVRSHDRLRLVQGLLLTSVGTWRAGQAVVEGRESNC